jgi:hypothetical protein
MQKILPLERLVVNGDLNLFNSPIKSLPQGIKIMGELGLSLYKNRNIAKRFDS